jgi:uncharacterized protein (TIGR02099 family)
VRWGLTLVALLLALVALLVILVRLALGFADTFTPRLETLLSSRLDAVVQIREIGTGLSRLDPVAELSDLVIRSREGLGHVPLIEVEDAYLHLDALASLKEGVPVVANARLSGVTLHLYQDEQRRWQWPDPAELPPEFLPEEEFDLERLDFWVGILLRQRAWVEETRVVLHGQEKRVTLHAPRLLMVGDAHHTHLEGKIHLEKPSPEREEITLRERQIPRTEEDVVMQAVLEIRPGPRGLRDFSAALQADMQLYSLMSLVEVLGRDDPVRLEAASGEARLWGRWQRGQLADTRLDLDIGLLATSHEDSNGKLRTIVLEDLEARGQWLRRQDGWEAWLEGDAASADWDEPQFQEEALGPALPTRWHARGSGEEWWLNTSAFDLASLAAWHDRVPLPEALARVVDTLDPRGRVAGLRLGRDQGEWVARAAVHEVAVSPWEQAPGGGPLDLWVEAGGRTGRVRFAGRQGTEFLLPRVFPSPLSLSAASGEVVWSFDGPRSVISGRNLRVVWQGAEVEGNFGLSAQPGQRGGLGVSLDFRDVDATDTPLLDWLPIEILEEGLVDWLGEGVAGRVPEGSLRLHLPLAGGAEQIPPSFGLDLAIEQATLPFASDWPPLEGVQGALSLENGVLSASVERAESLGVEARDGRVSLVDQRLEVSSDLAASAAALRRYLLAMPVEDIEAVEPWQGEGRVEGELELALSLDAPESLDLKIATRLDLSRLEHRPLALTLSDIQGPLAWRQRGAEGDLTGEVRGRLLGGPVRADIATRGGGLDLAGTATAQAISRWAGDVVPEGLVEGQFPWQGRLSFGDRGPSLRLDSTLQGLEIALPSPLGKGPDERKPLRLDIDLGAGSFTGTLGDRLFVRWRELAGSTLGQGQLMLGRPPVSSWPAGEGWWVEAYEPRLDLLAWSEALGSLELASPGDGTGMAGRLRSLRLETGCLLRGDHCLGTLQMDARPQAGGGWQAGLDGTLVTGRLDYRPGLADPLDIALSRLSLDGLMPGPAEEVSLFDEIASPPEPAPFPDWVGDLPAGWLRVADIEHRSQRFGPLTAHWQSTADRLSLAPLGLTLGEVSARGELVWETAGTGDSLTRARLDLDGRDLGTALERLGQPVSIRNQETRVSSQLAWQGAPWQFALERSRGSLDVTLRDGRFLNVESPSARLVGLLNVDNLLRRLRLDFSDVTGQGTAFDSVNGNATLYGGILETQGPIQIDGPATSFTLDGGVDLARRELDLLLGVTLPLSRNLPLAAVIAGAPIVGGALFIADRLFGDAIDRVTRIHYRVRGPWTTPQISLESAE